MTDSERKDPAANAAIVSIAAARKKACAVVETEPKTARRPARRHFKLLQQLLADRAWGG